MLVSNSLLLSSLRRIIRTSLLIASNRVVNDKYNVFQISLCFIEPSFFVFSKLCLTPLAIHDASTENLADK